MTLRSINLVDIRESDLISLKERGVSEGREIEYKGILPGGSDGAKKEFLHDVSSFANCIGGDLVFGVQEEQGVPVDIPGVDLEDVDREKQRLENLIRDSIKPRIVPAVAIHAVPLGNAKFVVIARVPRSLALPHAVTLGGSLGFSSRNSVGKYPLDVGEIRRAFIGSEQTVERLRRFRLDRVALISANETPVVLPASAKFVVHIAPLGAFDTGNLYDVSTLEDNPNLTAIAESSRRTTYNFDGLLCSDIPSMPPNTGYVQVFRNGVIEAVDTNLLRLEPDGRKWIRGSAHEHETVEAVKRYLSVQHFLAVGEPLAIIVTLTGVKGYRMYVGGLRFDTGVPIDRDLLLIPEVIVEGYNVNVGRALRPVFDAMWSAAGYPGSFSYDHDGNWRPR